MQFFQNEAIDPDWERHSPSLMMSLGVSVHVNLTQHFDSSYMPNICIHVVQDEPTIKRFMFQFYYTSIATTVIKGLYQF